MGPPWDGMLMPINRDEATSPEAGFGELRAGNLGVRLAVSAEELDAVQALRYRVFYQEMGAHADADLRRLSLGQRRRVHIARALARQPRLLVLDEPGANLDARALGQLCADLDALRRASGTALVHVAHDLAVARRFASHVALLDGGGVRHGRIDDLAAALAEAP